MVNDKENPNLKNNRYIFAGSGAVLGGLAGAGFGGPIGVVVGAVLGGLLGFNILKKI